MIGQIKKLFSIKIVYVTLFAILILIAPIVHLSRNYFSNELFPVHGEVLGLGTQKSLTLKQVQYATGGYMADVAFASDGTMFIAGFFSQDFDADFTAGTDTVVYSGSNNNVFVSKYNPDGSYAWTRTYNFNIGNFIMRLSPTTDGGVLLSGIFGGTADFDPGVGTNDLISAGNEDSFVTKLDSNGDFVDVASFGGPGQENEIYIAQDTTGNIYAVGNFNNTVDLDPGAGTHNEVDTGGVAVFIVKLDSSFAFQWGRRIGDVDPAAILVTTRAIVVNSATNDVVVAGRFDGQVEFNDAGGSDLITGSGDGDAYLTAYKTNGDYSWTRTFGDNTGAEQTEDLHINPVTSELNWIVKFRSASADADGTAGTDNLTRINPNWDPTVVKYQFDGDYVSSLQMANSDNISTYVYDSVMNAAGELFIIGEFDFDDQTPVDLDFTAGTFPYTPTGLLLTPVIYKVNNAGSLQLMHVFDDTTENNGGYIYAVAVQPDQDITIGGEYSGAIDWDPSAHSTSSNPNPDPDWNMLLLTYGDGFMTYVANLNASLRVLDVGTTFDAEIASELFVTGTRDIRLREDATNLLIASAPTQMDEIRDWTTVTGDTDLALEKTYIGNLAANDGVAATITVFVPIDNVNDNSIVICPNAISIAEVDLACPGGIPVAGDDASVSIVNIASQDYWQVTGFTNGGIITSNVVITPTPSPTPSPTASPTPSPTSSPTASPSASPTPTATPTATVTPTPTATPTETPTPTPTESPTATATVTSTVSGTPTSVFTGGDVIAGCPTIHSFSSNKTVITQGDTITLSWNTSNVETVDISPVANNVAKSGQRNEVVQNTKEFTLLAISTNCSREAKVSISVQVVAPEVLSAATVASFAAVEAATVVVSQIAPTVTAQQNLFSFSFAVIDRIRRRYPWGVIYNSKTKKPLGRAIVRIFDAATKQLVTTAVTDAIGVFRVFLKKGKYVMSVTKQGFTFPSSIITTAEDKSFTNIYRGEEFEVVEDGKLVMKSIPVDPESDKTDISGNTWAAISPYIEYLNSIILFGGVVTSIYTAIVNPLLSNFAVIGFYAGLGVVKLYLLQVPTEGKVKDEEGKPVQAVELGLFDAEFNTMVTRVFTDDKGKFSFYAPNADYYIKVVDERYTLDSENPNGIFVQKEWNNKGARVIFKDVKVKKK